MFATAVLKDEERAVDPQLGFPRGYAKLCRHAHIQAQGLISPFTEGPPQRFHPYAPQDEEIARFKGYDDLFPILDDEQRDATNSKKHIDSLWQQLDHMGNAGFDPAIFRIDVYGNVLYWDADPGSPLAWDMDHWFPRARGGKTVLSNLRLVQWQACQRKGKKLEFLVPWWDLQLGVSVNQFLSVFASKNTNFRHRAFSFFFSAGENEQINSNKVIQGHSWPRHFRDRKNQVGLAAAALVPVPKAPEGALRSLNTNYRVGKQEYQGHREEALRTDLHSLGLEYCKDDKDKPSSRGQWQLDKENKMSSADKYYANSAAQVQRELVWKQSIEEDKKLKMEESVQLEEELQLMKAQNVKEKVVLDHLEQALAKQKKRVEKQRQWSETQSQYRLCLEKMIRDTLHQCVVYKEQARLNQAACNALLARLDSQRSACDAAETDLLRKVKQREDLEATARSKITKRGRQHGHTDVGSCLKPNVAIDFKPPRKPTDRVLQKIPVSEAEEKSDHNDLDYNESKVHSHSGTLGQQPNHVEAEDVTANQPVFNKLELKMTCPKLLVRDKYSTKVCEMQVKEATDMPISGQNCEGKHAAEIGREQPGSEGNIITSQGFPGIKRKALEATDELDVVLLGYEYQENEDENANANREESVGDNGTTYNSTLKNYSDDDEDDAANQHSHNNNDAYEESNNADNLSEKEIEGSEAGETVRSEEGNEDEAEMGSCKVGDEDKPIVGISKTGENEQLVELLEGQCRVEKTKDDEQLDELLQQVLVMQDKVNEAMVEAIREEQDEDRVKRVGKLNLDKWLQKLLLDSGYGPGEEATSLQNIQQCPNNGLEGEKQIAHSAMDRNRGSTHKGKRHTLGVEKEMSDCPTVHTVQDIDSELVEAVRGGMIGGLWKKLSFKNSGSPGRVDAEHPMSGLSAEKTQVLKDVKKPEERRTSPWRWVSPVSKRSTSAGGETRTRRLSPWRRNSKEDKAEERKMMESFSKLKLGGGDKRQPEGTESNAVQKDEMFDNSMMARERGMFAKLKLQAQTPPLTQGIRKRSMSTPPAKTPCGQPFLSPAPIYNDALIAKVHPFAKQVQRRKDYGGTNKDVAGVKCTMPSVGANGGAIRKVSTLSGIGDAGGVKHTMPSVAVNGGAARKDSMLKKSASTRGGGGDKEDVAVACGGKRFEENEACKVSLFEDLDAQDGLRASLSLAWKKAVNKFELGKPPPALTPSAHPEL